MITVCFADLKLAHSVDKHNFTVYKGNESLVYNTYKHKTLKYIEQCDKIYRLKGAEHRDALKLFLKENFNIELI